MEDCGGMLDGKKLKASFPGSSVYHACRSNTEKMFDGLRRFVAADPAWVRVVYRDGRTVDVLSPRTDRVLQTRIVRLVHSMPRRY